MYKRQVLHRLSVSREDVRRADELYSKTSELQKILTNPEIPLAKKYDIIDKVFALDDTKELMKNFIKEMCKLGYCDEMRDIFDSYYRICLLYTSIGSAKLLSQPLVPLALIPATSISTILINASVAVTFISLVGGLKPSSPIRFAIPM